ncbi:hypothetical protein C8A05DRAFT_39411, partial [Staphylotrichum tortipilum]
MNFFSSSSAQADTARPLSQSRGLPYFAYGSNLHVAQMAQRCPDSVFLGKGTLPGYRWQINERGVANVVESPNHCVQGLVFFVNPRDERALDRSEGVARSLYLKRSLPIIFEPHPRYANYKSAVLARRLSSRVARPSTPDDPTRPRSLSSARARPRGPDDSEQIEALVYISDRFKTDGPIRDEYIQRMENAAADALELGVSPAFITDTIRPHLLPPPSPTYPPTSQQ